MKVNRLISIVLVLLDKERIAAGQLAEMFEVSLRTIYRDIETINLAGVPIRSIPGVGGGYEIMPEYRVNNRYFSSEDYSSILVGLSGLSAVINDKEIQNAYIKIRSMLPIDSMKEIELKADQIHIDLSRWIGFDYLMPYLEAIRTALRNSNV
ncbi:MAG: HTH domain-containing protein, partial [Oscillospiraceae bacterium]|nr:HTH domain-containing protein [Oscillospiraceae bacterium]